MAAAIFHGGASADNAHSPILSTTTTCASPGLLVQHRLVSPDAQVAAAARHEAGHVLVARRLSIDVAEVSIIAHGNEGGFTGARSKTLLPTRGDIERLATITLGAARRTSFSAAAPTPAPPRT